MLLSQALKACRDLKVELLVLPEVSIRPDTVAWLKTQLAIPRIIEPKRMRSFAPNC